MTATAHGIQFNPHIWVGIGTGFIGHRGNGYKIFPVPVEPSVKDFFGYYDEPKGAEQRNFVTTKKFNNYGMRETWCVPLFAELRVNLNNTRHNGRIIPYISAALGCGMGDAEGAFAQLKVGYSAYNKKKTFGASAFIGTCVVPYNYGRYCNEWELTYEYRNYSWEDWISTYKTYGDSWNYVYGHTLLFNLGINVEFGGAAGFKPRKK